MTVLPSPLRLPVLLTWFGGSQSQDKPKSLGKQLLAQQREKVPKLSYEPVEVRPRGKHASVPKALSKLRSQMAVLDLTDPFLTPLLGPRFLELGTSMEFLLLTVLTVETHTPHCCVILIGVTEKGGDISSTPPRAGSLPTSTTHRLPVHFAPWMIFKAF